MTVLTAERGAGFTALAVKAMRDMIAFSEAGVAKARASTDCGCQYAGRDRLLADHARYRADGIWSRFSNLKQHSEGRME